MENMSTIPALELSKTSDTSAFPLGTLHVMHVPFFEVYFSSCVDAASAR